MKPLFSYEDVFDPINQPIVGSKGSEIVFANAAAKSLFGNNICSQQPEKLFPPEVLASASDCFAVSAKLLGRNAQIFVKKTDKLTIYYITPEEQPRERLVLTRSMLSYLRNCTTGIKLSADRYFCKQEENQSQDRRAVSILYHYYYRLARTIIQMDSADKLGRKEMAFSPVITDMAALCSVLTGTLSNLSGYGNVTVNFSSEEERIFALVDPALIELMLLNLFSNSIKYSEQNCVINLSLKKNQDKVIISLDDNGTGLSRQTLADIFQPPDNRAEALQPDETIGLGLYISHSIVQLHNGTMLIESREGEGAHIRILLQTGVDETTVFNEPELPYHSSSIKLSLMGLADILPSDCYGPKFED